MNRGDIVRVAAAGDFGKPRPALVVQNDAFAAIPSVTVLLFTTELRDVPSVRIDIEPTAANGLRRPSQIMIDKITTVAMKRVGAPIGTLAHAEMDKVNRAMAVFLGLA
jgi:mRNA interferase MazF